MFTAVLTSDDLVSMPWSCFQISWLCRTSLPNSSLQK